MRRQLFNILSVISLLLCLLTALIWKHAGGYRDQAYVALPTGRLWIIESNDDAIGFPGLRFLTAKDWPGRLSFAVSSTPHGKDDRDYFALPYLEFSTHISSWGRGHSCTVRTGSGDVLMHIGNDGRPLRWQQVMANWSYPDQVLLKFSDVILAHWLVVLIFLAVPATRATFAVLSIRRTRRVGSSLCPTCGYDLRATPERCPECGTGTKPA
jgi:hypothetical protein